MSGSEPQDLAALQHDVERSREELAETIDQLTAKLDRRPSSRTMAVVAAALAATVALVVVLRRRQR